MKSSYIAAAAASSFALALALAIPPSVGGEQTPAPQAPSAQQGLDRSLGQVKPAPAEERRAQDLVGTNIVDEAGSVIGEIKGIVRGKETGVMHALVAAGGILGVGAKEVILPLDRLEPAGSGLTSTLASSAEQLKAQPAYVKSAYESVPDEQRVAIGAGGAPRTAMPVQFGALDKNKDGFIEKDEATGQTVLIEEWSQVDSNRDNRVDQAEFAAFEAAGPMVPGQRGDQPAHGAGAREAPASGSMRHQGSEGGAPAY